ncbi:MAG: PH domain-containing protein [Chloroflexota bacterium]
MPRYADTLLADGERVVLRTRQHPFATIVDGRRQWALLIASLVLLVMSLKLDGTVRDIVGWVVLAGIVLSGTVLVVHYWAWYAQDYVVTNRRVLKVEGIINKRSADSSLEKINDAVLEQNLFGRMLDYGDLNILTAADVDLDEYRMLNHAPAFKRQMLNQKHELETEIGRMPSPPLRAAPSVAEMTPVPDSYTGGPFSVAPSMPVAPRAPVPGASAPPPATAGGAAPHVMSAAEIVDAVGRLATLRDSGAITPAEFEAKKAELLRRL